VVDLFEERKQIEALEKANEEARKHLEGLSIKTSVLATRKENLEINIQDLEEKLSQLRAELLDKTEQLDAAREEVKAQTALVEALVDPSFEEIDARIASADETNKIAARIENWKASKEEHRAARARSINYTERMDAIKDYKGRLIAEAGMPVEGLGFENGMVTYLGRPLVQASGAEQIEVSCAVCMASHPRIGLLTLDTGWSELDQESQAVLRRWAEKVGAHIFVVLVSEEPQQEGWHFEDGEVTYVNGQPAPPPEAPEESEPKKKRTRRLKNQESITFGPEDPGVVVESMNVLPSWIGGSGGEEKKPPRLVAGKE
jgi:hypothetical protein